MIVRTVKRQRTISSQDIKEFTKVNASAKTVKRLLHKYGYASRIAKKKPFISENRKEILKFAKKHKNWIVNESKKGLWSDESMFTFRSKLPKRLWRLSSERFDANCMVGSVKQNKRIMV